MNHKFPGNLPYKKYSYNWTNQIIRTMQLKPAYETSTFAHEGLTKHATHTLFFRTLISHSWKPNKPNGDQPRRLSETTLLGINYSCSWWHLMSLTHVYRDNGRPLSFMQWWDQLWAHTDSYCSTNTLRCLEYRSPNPNYLAVIWSW